MNRGRGVVIVTAAMILIAGGIWLAPRILAIYHQVQGGQLVGEVMSRVSEGDTAAFPCGLNPPSEEAYRAELSQAIAHLQAALRHNPHLAQADLLLGRAYCLMGEYEEAIRSYQDYTRLRPENPLGHLELGFAYEAMGDSVLAVGQWQVTGVISQDFLDAGQEKYRTKHFQEALKWYRWASMAGWEGDAAYFSGLVYQDLQQWEEALGAYNDAIQRAHFHEASVSDVYFQLGVIYQWSPGYQNNNIALQMYDKAIELGVFSSAELEAETFYRRGEIFDRQGRDPRFSILEYQQALATRSDHHWAHLRLGYALYWAEKDVQHAEREIYQAIGLWPNEKNLKWAYQFLGDIYQDAGLIDKAIAAYQEVLQLDPTDEEVQNLLNAFLASQTGP